MKIVFFGSAEFGIPSLEAIKASNNQIVHIFTQPPHPAGRGRKPRPTPVACWAAKNNIPFEEAQDINEPEAIRRVASCGAELLVVIAFGQKISRPVINLFARGAVNVHASLLPKYRGAAPINWAIVNNETTTGITIITLADKIDAGLMLADMAVPILPDDNVQTLHDKLAHAAAGLLPDTIGKIESGRAVYVPQDPAKVTFAPKLKKSDGYIDWSLPAEVIANRIRGFWPWPGAQAEYVSARIGKCGHVIFAEAAVAAAENTTGQYGMLDENLNVICGRDRLKILKLKPAGSSLMDFDDFVNGRATAPGDVFLAIDKRQE